MEGDQWRVNGVAHIFLTASNFERSREFYRKLLPFLGLKPVIDYRDDLLLRRRTHRGRHQRAVAGTRGRGLRAESASACTTCVFVPASAPISTNCIRLPGDA